MFPLRQKMHHTKFEQNWLNGFRKKLNCLIGTHEACRTIHDDDGRKLIPLGHLIDPGYLKITTKKSGEFLIQYMEKF